MEDKIKSDEEIIDLVRIINSYKILSYLLFINLQLYPTIAPENIDNSKIASITSEQYTIKIDDLLLLKEISKYISDKQKLIQIFKKFCEFFKFSENDEVITYDLPENMSVFSILNIPPKMSKEEVFKNLELVNLQYNRLYKRGFYWVISTTDKETVICIQNSLHTLSFDDLKTKYDLKNKNQIWKLMKEQIDKIAYQKESKNLGVWNNKNNSSNKHKSSNNGSEALSWRKGSGEGSSFDYNEKHYKKGYYNNNYNKRKRFNSDHAVSNNQKEYKEYWPQSNNNKDIEIDISNLKYPVIIKYKYSFKDIENFYNNLVENKNNLPSNPFVKENKEIFGELISEKPKTLVSLKELIEVSNNNYQNKNKGNEINSKINIPKMNPLSNMGKIPFYGKKEPNLSNTIEESNKDS